MSKSKFSTVYGVHIYPIEYLMNEELTDDDLSNLFDKKCLTYSIIVEMFHFANIGKSDSEIIHLIQTDKKWMYKYHWTKREQQKFEKKIAQAIQNIEGLTCIKG